MAIKIYEPIIFIPGLVPNIRDYLAVPEGCAEGRREESVKQERVGFRAVWNMFRDKQVRSIVRDRVFGPRIKYR